MGYTAQFENESAFNAALEALGSDLNTLQLPNLEANSRIRINPSTRTIEFDGNAMELGILFGNPNERKTATMIPFNTGHAPTEENFLRVAGERGISGVTVRRNEGSIAKGYFDARKEADAYFSTAVFPKISSSRGASAREAFDTAVANNESIVVNEAHGDQAHLRYVIDRMPQFAGKNYAIALEHFFLDQQALIDAYFNSPDGAPMPRELAIYVDQFIDPRVNRTGEITAAHVYTTRELLETAKRYKVPVVAIETEESFGSRSFRLANMVDGAPIDDDLYGLPDRLALMNYNVGMIDAARRAVNPDARLVAIAGAAHGITCTNPTTSKIVPGLGQILGGKTFYVVDRNNAEKTAAHIRLATVLDAYRNSDYVFTLDDNGQETPVDLSPLGLPSPSWEAPQPAAIGQHTARQSFGDSKPTGWCR